MEIPGSPLRLNLAAVGEALDHVGRLLNAAAELSASRIKRFNRTYRGQSRASTPLNARSISAKVREDTRRVRHGLSVSTVNAPVLPEGITRPVSRSAAHLRASLHVAPASTPEDVSEALQAAQSAVWESLVRRAITNTWRNDNDADAWNRTHDSAAVGAFIVDAQPSGEFTYDWIGEATSVALQTINQFWDIYHESLLDSAVPVSDREQLAKTLGGMA